jgi:apolipoprotein N-acyltransferase
VFGLTVALGGDARWVAAAGVQYFHLPHWSAAAAAGALGVLFGGSFGLLLGVLLHSTLRLRGAWPIVACGAAWAAWESLTIAVVPYYPWVSLAATQAETPMLLQLASLAGQSAVSCAMAATGTAFGLALQRRSETRVARRFGIAGSAILAAVVGFGWVRLAASPRAVSSECTISAVDARIAPDQLPRERVLRRYAALARRAQRRHPSAIVWPESALPGYVETDLALQRHVRQLVATWGVPLVAGGPRVEWAGGWSQHLFNSAYLIESAGPLRSYDKRRLVPFAEYWPRALGWRPGWLPAEEVTAGRRPIVFAAGHCRLGMLICFEAEHPWVARELVRSNATTLLVLSNDAQLPEMAVRKDIIQAQIRAVETGLPVIRAANRGTSVAIDRYGAVVQRQRGGVLTAKPAAGAATPAVWLAPTFTAVCWAVAAASVGLALRSQRRAPGTHGLPKLSRDASLARGRFR